MIEAIYWLAIFAVVLVNVTALTLLTRRYIPFPATSSRNRHHDRLPGSVFARAFRRIG